MPKKIMTAINSYIDILKKDNLPIKQVFLFGSYAKGKQNKRSNVDLCIVSPKFKDAFKAAQYLWLKVNFDPKATIEPIGFNPKNFREGSSLIEEIKKRA